MSRGVWPRSISWPRTAGARSRGGAERGMVPTSSGRSWSGPATPTSSKIWSPSVGAGSGCCRPTSWTGCCPGTGSRTTPAAWVRFSPSERRMCPTRCSPASCPARHPPALARHAAAAHGPSTALRAGAPAGRRHDGRQRAREGPAPRPSTRTGWSGRQRRPRLRLRLRLRLREQPAFQASIRPGRLLLGQLAPAWQDRAKRRADLLSRVHKVLAEAREAPPAEALSPGVGSVAEELARTSR